MNKSDIKLIVILCFMAIILFSVIAFSNKKTNKKALVYYDNNLIKTIDLNVDETVNYEVDGYNGKLKLVVQNGKIKVEEENSPLHLCSKQGFIDKTYESIICLPNKIVIKIVSDNKENYDTIIR